MLKKDIEKTIIQMGKDVAVIKSILIGNGREGILKKVERHDKYFYVSYGCIIIMSLILGIRVF